ncbi:SUMF1/EgtB/PvdO family nonheme iron enzyme [Leptolyngbya sp. PCC 6406]|uniref:SUMF1/EgtB/PvdO family nonheme iron enzyme n=1 Tax=Leptolyngbya sp. PCC 6406 TaxID=1173264 RepID=UPI0002AC4B15|nr:SUMF1/EgtB/PvdO family nonheme iron enzyme [Leptolyngbya sp. PCC 6406]
MGERRALLVGVSDYGEGFEPLPGSVLDVQAMTRVLSDPEGGAFDVTSLENCDSETFRTHLEQFFQRGQSEDLLLLYFSGHGDLGSGGILSPQLHFCTRSSQKPQGRLVESSAVSATFLQRRMELSRSQRIVVILDCCYSGAIADLLKKGDTPIDFGELKAKGRVILASSSATNIALQEKDGLSLYTRYLVEGMEGAAYPGHGDWILVRDLHNHAERRFEIERKGGYLPKILAEDTGFDLPLVRAPKLDAEQEYRKAVDDIFQELDAELDLDFNGTIEDDLDRGILETRRQRLGLTREAAAAIEAQVQAPYQKRASQRREYAKYFQMAAKNGYLPTERNQRRLAEIRLNLGLGSADATKIEQALTQRLNLKPTPAAPPPAPVGWAASPPIPEGSSPNTNAAPVGWAPPTIPTTPSTAPETFPTFEFSVLKITGVERKLLGLGSPRVLTSREQHRAEYRRETLPGEVPLDLVKIPPGEFWMGSPDGEGYGDEKPRHRVQVPGFWLGKYAITQAQWRAVAGLPKVKTDLKPDPAHVKGNNCPVERVSWYDAVEFCDRLTRHSGHDYRLPSEAEWEYACRAGTETPFHCGDTITPDLANYDGNYPYGNGPKGTYRQKTLDVGSFPPNAFGLYDMHGNVWEWCQDPWHGSYEGAPTDGSAWLSSNENENRLLRGGSWYDDPRYCRSANRNWGTRDNQNYIIGFRVVCVSSWPLP